MHKTAEFSEPLHVTLSLGSSGKVKGRNVVKVVWVFRLSSVCNSGFFLSLVNQKERILSLEVGAEDIQGWSSP